MKSARKLSEELLVEIFSAQVIRKKIQSCQLWNEGSDVLGTRNLGENKFIETHSL